MFWKMFAMESAKFFFFEMKEGYKASCVKILIFRPVIKRLVFIWNIVCRNQHLFEILQTSLTFKDSENVVKSGCFENLLRWRAPIFSEMKEGYKINFVKILIFW